MEGKTMKAKRWLALAVGVMLVMNMSAHGARRFEGKGKGRPIRMEQKMVRCERCGKMIDLRKAAQFRELRREAFFKSDFRKGDFRGPEFKKHHRHHGRR
jgi:hypothetical protein